MAQRTFLESGRDGRSVLGMLAVQVERDLKTGATVVRSVAPVSTGAANATTVFDDGRKTIHAVGGSGVQPSTEELGQILSIIDGVGMKVLLDDVSVNTDKTENVVVGRPPEEECLSSSHATLREDNTETDSYKLETQNSVVNKEERSRVVVRDAAGAGGKVEHQRLEDIPVTLMFLGYTGATAGQGHNQGDHEGVVSVERVIITEDGEEHLLEPETLEKATDQEAEKDKVFQDISLDGNEAGVKVQGQGGDEGLQRPPIARAAEAGESKSCQCCSVM